MPRRGRKSSLTLGGKKPTTTGSRLQTAVGVFRSTSSGSVVRAFNSKQTLALCTIGPPLKGVSSRVLPKLPYTSAFLCGFCFSIGGQLGSRQTHKTLCGKSNP